MQLKAWTHAAIQHFLRELTQRIVVRNNRNPFIRCTVGKESSPCCQTKQMSIPFSRNRPAMINRHLLDIIRIKEQLDKQQGPFLFVVSIQSY